MPLHLLGKKSWNVYNPESIARVRKDEAAAKLRDQERERNARHADSARRLELLRTGNSTDSVQVSEDEGRSKSPNVTSRRKRRKLAGENDTDWEVRLARENIAKRSTSSQPNPYQRSTASDAIENSPSRPTPAQEQGMRFIDAAGTNRNSAVPWYSTIEASKTKETEPVGLDRWGNEDLGRRQREQRRLDASDPLMAMKKAVKQLKENERERRDWMAQREQDLEEVEHLAKKTRHKRRHHADEDNLDNFSLDTITDKPDARRRHRHHRHRHGHRDQSHQHHRSRHRDRSQSTSRIRADPKDGRHVEAVEN